MSRIFRTLIGDLDLFMWKRMQKEAHVYIALHVERKSRGPQVPGATPEMS